MKKILFFMAFLLAAVSMSAKDYAMTALSVEVEDQSQAGWYQYDLTLTAEGVNGSSTYDYDIDLSIYPDVEGFVGTFTRDDYSLMGSVIWMQGGVAQSNRDLVAGSTITIVDKGNGKYGFTAMLVCQSGSTTYNYEFATEFEFEYQTPATKYGIKYYCPSNPDEGVYRHIYSTDCADVFGDGTMSYDPEKNELTLNNYQVDLNGAQSAYPIVNESVAGLKIVLKGDNKLISGTSTALRLYATTTLTGEGKLTATAIGTISDGIYISGGGNLTIDGCEVVANSAYGVEGSGGTLTITNGAKVSATGAISGSITGWGSIVLDEDMEILSPAGAQIASGQVQNAEGALLKSEVVIGVPAEETIPATSVTLDQDSLKMYMGVGTATLKATVLPANTTDFVEWSVVEGGESFVSVLSGIVTALAEGEAKVVAKAGDVADTCVVVVGPAPVDYKITVNTTAAGNFQITSANCTDVLNDGGSFKFDNATKTITLTNCHFTSDTYPLTINQSVNIVLVGENSITSTISATALKFASGDATIGGGGKLTLSCVNTGGADGIYCPGGNLTINECEIYAEGGYGIEGGSTRALTINPGAKVTAYGPNKGSFTGWSSIVLGEGVEILSPAGAQIVGGDVKDAEGALLKSEVVIGTPAPAEFKGAYTVGGEGADFASLYAACDSVNKAVIAGDLAGDIELLIAADLVEPKNIGLINTTDYTITIRPDKDEDRTIQFTQTTDNAGPSGAFVIGCDMGITFTATPTKNIIIDGFAEGGDTRRLTFKTSDGFGSKAGPIIAYGKVETSAIKNCNVINDIYHTSTSAYGVTVRNEKSTNNAPVEFLIENNHIEVIVAFNGQCIQMHGSQAVTANEGAAKNTIIRNNELLAATRGIFFNGANGATIEGNIFKINQVSGGRLSHGIMGNAQCGVINVRGNKFVELTSVNVTAGDYGIQAITASGGASVWMIENNFFGGFDAGTACAGKPTKICGVRMGDSCVVRHNTFEMPVLSNTPSTTLLTNAPITLLYYAGTKNYVVENNIFISHETAANNSLARGTITANTKNNLYYIDAAEQGNAVVMDAGTPAATFADLPAEIQAKSINAPIELVKGYMVAESSLGNRAFGVPAIEGLMTDIDGADRHAPMAFVGCYEAEDINALPLYATLAEAVDGKTIRRAVACDDAVYVLAVDADKAPTLVKADFEGNVVTTFATDFCTGGSNVKYILSDIALTADGVLIGCNADSTLIDPTTDPNHGAIKAYKWAADGTGEVLFTCDAYIYADASWTAAISGETMAFHGTLADGQMILTGVSATGANKGRMREIILNITDGAIASKYYNKPTGNAADAPMVSTVFGDKMQFHACGDKYQVLVSGSLIAPRLLQLAAAETNNGAIAAQMADDYIGIEGFSFAKVNEKDLMIIPAEDGATVLDITSGLATAVVEKELTTQGVTCDFMHAALVANGTKVMLMRDADIILLDMPAGPGTNLNEIKADAKAIKIMRNGHVFIIRDGKMFNMQGMIVK